MIGLTISIIILCANVIATGFILNHYPGSEVGVFGPNFFQKVYITPWCRIGPYVIGILVGYLIFLDKKHQKPKLRFVNYSLNIYLLLTR